MNAPRDLGPDFRSWLRDVPPTPAELPARTLDQTRNTPQRRRWLWFLPGRKPAAGADDREGHIDPAVLSTTTPIGGTRTMFSATKLVAAAAAVALSGVLLLAGPFTPQEHSAPAAPDAFEPGVITPVQGTMHVGGQTKGGDGETYAGGPVSLDEWWTTRYEMDDPRLSGVATSRHNRNIGATTTYAGGTRMITARIDNDGGSWVGTGRAYSGPESGIHYQMLFEGQDGYEGLHAIIALDTESTTVPFEVTGAIISGDLPELPEPVPAPIE